ncbi:hypothetical protein K435DRAFT_396879 [Dendrothele bispora CBS 962.96]|uniref:Uncharacterized protein n=1 Tax=Dendrothele bispora (strain CBS 962.96) TaxID=1314807 RepID=A0A4S8L877_DENBC|nr:hypothetical protein K435DRAFT_397684 [Dendrothele bispora CBS 962.96]THU84907.1 hypothetical protein K435DRAFT_396879 [Dendrothele bispora CBS 962.96]
MNLVSVLQAVPFHRSGTFLFLFFPQTSRCFPADRSLDVVFFLPVIWFRPPNLREETSCVSAFMTSSLRRPFREFIP